MSDSISDLHRYVEEHAQESLQELASLCRQPSVSAQGFGMHACAGMLAELLRSHGIATQVVETAGYPAVLGEYGAGDQALLLYNHYDVQPPDPLALWDTPPFEPGQREGKLFGRGAVDDKGLTGAPPLAYRGHQDEVRSVAWSPNGRYVASGSWDGTVQVWDAQTGRTRVTYRGHRAGVWATSWSPDGNNLASASKDQTVQVWQALTGKLLLTYRGHASEITKVSWSPDGKHIASVSDGGVVQLWNAMTGKQVWLLHL